MKVLFLSQGNCIHTTRWVNALYERGINVLLVSLPDQVVDTKLINPNIEIKYLKFGGKLGYYLNFLELKKIISCYKPDLMNVHYASGYGTLARLTKFHPSLLSVWGSDVYQFPYESKLNKYLLNKNLNSIDFIASTSECMANQVCKISNVNKKIFITPFGVDTLKFKNLGYEKEGFNFGIVKTLKPIYGINFLIEAFSLFLKKIEYKENIYLQIYGDGENKDEYLNLAKNLNISDRVKFNGFIINDLVPDVINKLDVFCLSSINESFGVAAVEAMACEVPIIATDAEGFVEVIGNSENGIIVPKKDSVTMANAMYELYIDENKRKKLAKNAKERMLKYYDWDKNVTHMINVYKSCIKNNKS